MDNKEIAKNYVKASINDVELVFYNREQERLKEVKYPFYDGGVSPIVIYYSRKYNLPMVLPIFLKNISGDTIPQISNNFYSSSLSGSSLGTLNLSMSNDDEDLFKKDYLKNYYFLNKFYNFNIVFVQFKDLYEKKQLNLDGIFIWVEELPNLLLSLLILKEKPSLGIKLTDNLESPNSNSVNASNINTNSPQTIQKIEDKFSLYYDYIKEITEKYLSNTASKKKEDYLTIFWIYQLLEPKSATIKKEGLENVLDLLKMRGKKKLWNINNPTNTSSTDNQTQTQTQTDPQDYKLSWIIYGLIKDYLSINFDFFLSSYTLNQISKGLVYEGFESLEDLNEIEGFTGSQSNKKKSKNTKKSKNDKNTKEKFTDDKKKKVSVWWTLLFCFFILPLFMVIFIKIMMFFWSFSFGSKK